MEARLNIKEINLEPFHELFSESIKAFSSLYLFIKNLEINQELIVDRLCNIEREILNISKIKIEITSLGEILINRLDAIQNSIKDLYNKNALLESVSRDKEKLMDDFINKKKIPIARDLISIQTNLAQLNGMNEDFADAMVLQINETLLQLDLKQINVNIGDKFNPQSMKPIGRIPASSLEQHFTVAKIVQPGVFMDGWKFHTRVIIYEYKEEKRI